MKNWTYGGSHQESAAICKLCSWAAPENSLQEHDAFGFGGGIAFGFFTFEYKGELPHLYIGTMNWWHQPGRFFENAARAAGCTVRRHIASSATTASNKLHATLAHGEPVIISLDERALSGQEIDPARPGRVVYPVVTGINGDTLLLDYLDSTPHEISIDAMESGRAVLKRSQFEFFTVTTEGKPSDKSEAFITCIKEQSATPLNPGIPAKPAQKRIGLPGMELMVTMLEGSGKGSLSQIGSSPESFASLMKQMALWIAEAGTGGDAMRSLYAQFLKANGISKQHNHAAQVFEQSAVQWRAAAGVAQEFVKSGSRRADFASERAATLNSLAERFKQIFELERHGFALLKSSV